MQIAAFSSPERTQKVDEPIAMLADYTHNYIINSQEAFYTARACLADALGCGILALRFPACHKLLGPFIPGTVVPGGSHVPGTQFVLDPIRAAFNIGTMVRWLDYNDAWLASEWGHPSDNLGAILAVTDYLSRKQQAEGKPPVTIHRLLEAMIKAHEIQGSLAILNSFNRVGLDHVILVKVASTAVATWLLGGHQAQIEDAISQAWIDIGSLRTYRHAPNTGSRKSWAAGDATSCGVHLAWLTLKGEMGYPTALSTPQWGFYDAIFKGQTFKFQQPLNSYVMENILFKISFPAEFHAQTAVECALALYPIVKNKWQNIERILIETHESAIRIIDKKGPLYNPADRDHCLQYMIAIGLLKGKLTAEDYEDEASRDPQIDLLRSKMEVIERPSYSIDYLDPQKRSIANAITIYFKDGTETERVAVEYPQGHKRRRSEGLPLLFEKFSSNLRTHYPENKVAELNQLFHDHDRLMSMPVHELVDMF